MVLWFCLLASMHVLAIYHGLHAHFVDGDRVSLTTAVIAMTAVGILSSMVAILDDIYHRNSQ